MAMKQGIALVEDVTLAAATAKTVLQIVAATNHPVRIDEVIVGFDGTDNTHEPVEVQLVRQSDAGTMSSVTILGANDSDADTFDTSAQHTATAEPTGSTVLRKFRVHPQTGFAYQPSDNAPIMIGAGDRIGLVCVAANAVNVDAQVNFTE